MASVFFSYSHLDEDLRDQLEKQLSILKGQGAIETWHDRRIGAGEEIDKAISNNLMSADIILLLVSPDFINSDYCYDREMTAAMERHEEGSAVVIPVILRACDWHGAPFGKLNATPPDGRPITQAVDRDQALLEVAKAVRAAAGRIGRPPATTTAKLAHAFLTPTRSEAVLGVAADRPRSSNLRMTKTFTDRDRDRFKSECFKYIAKFFENTLQELQTRNTGVEGDFRRIDANRFTASAYRGGRALSRCTVFVGGSRGFIDGIAYSEGEISSSNSFNEMLQVENDDQTLFLRSTGMRFGMGRSGEKKPTAEGGAELRIR
ncbi:MULTISPECIES: toll/interleukin-1 receptor domain-containing protein [Rhizobium]|uniref:TIR domain-containing protein n=1 Tax=Rhizobium phaseoli TaxID=396 RepID=A0A7X6IZM5_9HYPH|nr:MULTISPECIES: toll/interleukin-1 receptor domain-containing protein [Rhizobium]MDE8761395.1 TIR domain-containing protein [Rhizobium sp. CBK13]NKF13118.1 TIR domain-containing protein [Rhizobium phaseoli]QPK10922.1 TIR domain-containing protein [Rhizobium phaseoli]